MAGQHSSAPGPDPAGGRGIRGARCGPGVQGGGSGQGWRLEPGVAGPGWPSPLPLPLPLPLPSAAVAAPGPQQRHAGQHRGGCGIGAPVLVHNAADQAGQGHGEGRTPVGLGPSLPENRHVVKNL